jgi:predicted nucleic acid-binding protein
MIDLAALGLGPGDLVLVDSGPLIYLSGPSADRRRETVEAFLEAAKAGGLGLVASTLAWTEVLRGCLSSGDTAAAEAARRFLSDSALIRLEPLDVAVAEEAAALLAARRIELADAIHVATAIVAGARAMLTNDEAWRDLALDRGKKGGRGLPRALLVDELAFMLEG